MVVINIDLVITNTLPTSAYCFAVHTNYITVKVAVQTNSFTMWGNRISSTTTNFSHHTVIVATAAHPAVLHQNRWG